MSNLQIYNLFKNGKKIDGGKLITVEGLDASGKRTQVKNIEDYIREQGYKIKTFSFPQYENPIGKVISSYLRGDFGNIDSVPYELICIAYAADRAQASREIKSLLQSGYVVLSDRYTYSNVFTAAKMEEEKWLNFIDWVEDMEFNQLGVAKPNFNLYLHVDPEISIQRIEERGKREYQNGKEDIHENNFKLLRDTSKAYLTVAANKNNWFVIDQMVDGKQISKDEAFSKIKIVIDQILGV